MISDRDSPGTRDGEVLAERVEALATWLSEIETRMRAAEVASGDEKTAKELRRALEALAKHDPKLEERVGNRVDVLADRFATLASTVSTTAAAIAAKDGELTALRRDLDAGLQRLEALATQRGKALESRELASLRKEVATLATERSSRKVGPNNVDLARKVEYLGERIDTLGSTVSTTAAGLAGRDGELAQLRRSSEETAARIETVLAELRRATDPTPVLELRREVSELAARGSEVTELRAAVEGEVARLDATVATLEQSLGTLASHVEQAAAAAAREQAAGLEDKIGALDERLESFAHEVLAQVSAVGEGYSAKELELAALARTLEESNARADALATELRTALEAPREPVRDAELEANVAEVALALQRVQARVEEIDASVASSLADVAVAHNELRTELAIAGQALARADEQAALSAALDARLGALSAEVAHVADELSARHGDASSRIDTLAAELRALAEAPREPVRDLELEARVGELDGSLERVLARVNEVDVSVDTALEGVAATHDELRAELRRIAGETQAAAVGVETQLAELAAEAGRASGEAAEREAELHALRARYDEGVVQVERLVTDLQGALRTATESDAAESERLAALDERLAAFEAGELSPHPVVAARLDDLGARVSAVEATANAGSEHDELARLRSLVDALEARVTASEAEVVARVDALEAAREHVVLPAEPASGEGRFRLELRGLELRMQHAEAAARENREAVLTQLERLASKIEWRLQRLEGEDADAASAEAARAGAQVVPIRTPEV